MADLAPNIKRFLASANAKWKEEANRAKEDKGQSQVDDGRYVAKLSKTEFTTSRDDKPMIVTTYVILEGDFKGEKVKSYRTFGSEDAFFYFGKEVMVLGYDPEDIIWDPKKATEEAFILNFLQVITEEKPVCRITLRTRKDSDFQGVNLENVIEDYEGDQDIDEEEEKPRKKAKEEDDEEEPEAEEKPSKATKKPTSAPAKKGLKKPKDEDEEEEEVEEVETEEAEAEEPEEEELKIGMKVAFTFKGEEFEGVVKEVLEDEEKAKIKVGNKIYTIAADKIAIVDGETD